MHYNIQYLSGILVGVGLLAFGCAEPNLGEFAIANGENELALSSEGELSSFGGGHWGHKGKKGQRLQRHLKKLKAKLDLSDAQTTAVEGILKETFQQMRQQMRQLKKQFFETAQAQIEGVLNDDQIAEFKDLVAKMKAKHKGRHGHRSH